MKWYIHTNFYVYACMWMDKEWGEVGEMEKKMEEIWIFKIDVWYRFN